MPRPHPSETGFDRILTCEKTTASRCCPWALRIHPPDVIGKYCPESVIGSLGSGAPAAPAASGGLAEPLLAKGGHQAKGWKELHSHGSSSVQTLKFKVNVVCAFAPCCAVGFVTVLNRSILRQLRSVTPTGKGLVSLRKEPRVAHEGRRQDSRVVGCTFLHGLGVPEGGPFHHCATEERDFQW